MPLPQPATIIQLSTTSSSQRHQDAEAEVLLPTASHDSSSPTRRQAAGHPSATRHAVQTDSQATAAAGWQAGHHLHTSQPGTSGDTRAKLCLCGAHALARWGWRTWEFAVALILIRLFPMSLRLVSVFGLLDNIVRLAFGSLIGQYVDRTERLRGAVTCYGIQNLCIAVSAAAAAALVLLDAGEHGALQATHPVLYWGLISVVLLAGASSSVGSLGAAVAVEREYSKTLCGDDSAGLRKLNSGMRAIDLTSQILGPAVSGLLMSYSSMLSAILVLAAYSLAAWVPEGLLLQAAHRHSPRLREPKPFAGISSSSRPNALRVLLGASGWAAYFHQSTLLPGLALALLYLSVLSLGSLMTSYLAWQGLSEATLSLFRAVGALSGLLATVVFPPLQHCGVGLVGAGALGISWQLSWLLVGVAPVMLAHASGHPVASQALSSHSVNATAPFQSAAAASLGPPSTSPSPSPALLDAATNRPGILPHHLLYVLLVGLVASRFGLWLFDLCVTQLQQELVPATELGTVSGVQGSLQSAFEVLAFIAATIVSRPPQFPWLMAGSCAAVACAACLFLLYAWRTAGGSRQEPLAALARWLFGRKPSAHGRDHPTPTGGPQQLSVYSHVQDGSGRQSAEHGL